MSTPKCCNEESTKVEFSTFSYWYCKKCKREVSEESVPDRSEDESEWPDHWFKLYERYLK